MPTNSSEPANDRQAASSTAQAGEPAGEAQSRRLERGFGWYVTFIAIAVLASLAIYHYTGQDALAATARFLWNGLALLVNGAIRASASLLALLARGVGWRRLWRLSNVVMGVGLSYSAGVILSDKGVRRAQTWSGRLKTAIAIMQRRWHRLHLFWKLAIVAVLIASQLYLHFLLIIFPIAFLVPFVRRMWVQAADLMFGSWYWKTLGGLHRRLVTILRNLPLVRHVIGAARLTRIRYLYAWRLWRYHPRYRCEASNTRKVDLLEPFRLWRRGELDGYVGHRLLRGVQPAAGDDGA